MSSTRVYDQDSDVVPATPSPVASTSNINMVENERGLRRKTDESIEQRKAITNEIMEIIVKQQSEWMASRFPRTAPVWGLLSKYEGPIPKGKEALEGIQGVFCSVPLHNVRKRPTQPQR